MMAYNFSLGRMNFLVGRYERNYLKKLKELEEDKTEGDVIVEHICPRCNYNLATYDTAQTRSADEGQTVFYSCVKCKHRSIEYS